MKKITLKEAEANYKELREILLEEKKRNGVDTSYYGFIERRCEVWKRIIDSMKARGADAMYR